MHYRATNYSHSKKKSQSSSVFMQKRRSGDPSNLKIADILSDVKNSSTLSYLKKENKRNGSNKNNNNMIYFPEIVGSFPKVTNT